MTHDPRTQEDIYQSLKDNLTGKITKLTNFTDRSFNYVFTQAFAEEIRELEVLATAAEFAGWIDYVGGDITQSQLDTLGYDDLSPEEINEVMEDEYLDEYVKIVGINRFEGARATGTVTIETQSRTTLIPEGTVVSTSPDSDGSVLEFETTEDAETGDNVTVVSNVPIEAVEVGVEHNVSADTIVRFSDPPLGVRGVSNPESTTGGEGRESNEELRNRAKSQVEGASEGGTVEGIKAYLRQNIEAVGEGDVIIEEFVESKPPFVDVIVDGGSQSDVRNAIEFSRPAGVKHNLIRPQVYQLGVRADVVGSDINTSLIEDELSTYLLNLGIGETVYQDQLINLIMNRDSNVENVGYFNPTYDRVTNERFTFNQDLDSAIFEDGGSLSNQTADANDDGLNDMTLLPSNSAEVGDAYYFGSDNRFSGFDIFVSTAGTGTWTIVWEYYDGSDWVQFPTGNLTDTTDGWRNANQQSVYWDVPSDWVKTEVDTDEAYFVRARVDTADTSITDQPLGEQVRLTGGSYGLDLTYEDVNGSITVEDSDGVQYDEGADFTVVDKSGDGWPETILWDSQEAHPDHLQDFFVDYDVTTAATTNGDKYGTNLVRDEQFTFDVERTETYTYDQDVDYYRTKYVPFDGSTSITDQTGATYAEGTDYEIISVGFDELRDETFTYNSSKDTYYLKSGADETTVEIRDENETLYIRGTDYTVIDSDGDGVKNAIQWDTNASIPSDGTTFTVEYQPDNGIPQSIDWSIGGSTPSDNDDFTITYNKKMYHLEYEVIETPSGEIADINGTIYEQDVDYDFVDYNADDERDTISFFTNPSTLVDGEEFYVSYFTEGDVNIESREKASPSTNRIDVSVQ